MSDTKNPFSLHNVRVKDKLDPQYGGAPTIGVGMLQEVAYLVALNNPLWLLTGCVRYHNRVDRFEVVQDGETLGVIKESYYRGEYCVEVENTRIAAMRERNGGYRSKDINKILAKIKKSFSRRTIGEHIAEAHNRIENVLGTQGYGKNREHQSAVTSLERELVIFARNDAATQAAFSAYLHAHGKDALSRQEKELRLEAMTIESIRHKYTRGNAIVVLKVDGKYLVKQGEEAILLDDNSLPQKIRGKLGMLKLVDDEHSITGVGCRVNSETFVIIEDEEGEVK